MKAAKITRLSPDEAEELRKRGFAGDLQAAKEYLLYALWREVRGRKGFSMRAKVRAFVAMADSIEVKWQTTSS